MAWLHQRAVVASDAQKAGSPEWKSVRVRLTERLATVVPTEERA